MEKKYVNKKLYIEYRVYFSPMTNQDMLHEVAEAGQEAIYNLFDNQEDSPSPHDVTYEVVMTADEVTK